jgi:non-specific serine/threonine protein kinase
MTVSTGALPRRLSRFLGRTAELDYLLSLLGREARPPGSATAVKLPCLITLTGVGGAGKTRLAHELGTRVAAGNSDGNAGPDRVCWVALETVTEPGRVSQVVAAALGLAEAGSTDPLEAVLNKLRELPMLLILDNCEPVATSCRELVGALLSHCAHLAVVATSREPLGVPGEVVIPVGSMSSDVVDTVGQCGGSGAVALFLDRSKLADSPDTVSADELKTITTICQRLGGLPLAIELAASWFRVLSPGDLLAEIDHSISFLSATEPELEERHRSLEVVLQKSWEWLDPGTQRVLRGLSVLQGDFSREAAEAVAGSSLASLSALAESALIERRPQKNGSTRFHMHGLVRQFATSQLRLHHEEAERIHRAHQHFFLAAVEEGADVWETAAESDFLDRLQLDRPNLEAALARALSRGDAEAAMRFCSGLFSFWVYGTAVREYGPLIEAAIALRWNHSAVSPARVKTLIMAGYAAMSVDDFERAQARFAEAHRLSTEVRDPSLTAWALRGRGFHARFTGDAPSALEHAQASLVICRAHGELSGEAWSLHALGEVEFLVDRLAEAEHLFEAALLGFAETGVSFGTYRALTMLGAVSRRTFRWAAAAERYQEALRLQRSRRYTSRGADLLEGIAEIAATLHRPVPAARLFGAAARWRRSFGYQRYLFDSADFQQGVASAKSQLSERRWASAFAQGARLTSEQACSTAESTAAEIAASVAQPSLPARLTARETQVLHLLVLGLEDREIAAQLTVSPRTVHAHLRSVYNKLDVTSRTAAAHRAVALNLA